jgi:HEAT repeat protein
MKQRVRLAAAVVLAAVLIAVLTLSPARHVIGWLTEGARPVNPDAAGSRPDHAVTGRPAAPEEIPAAREAFVRRLQDADEAALGAVDGLANLGPEGASALGDALKSGSEKTRAAAAHALGDLGPDASAAVPALVAALKDPSPGVRRAASAGPRPPPCGRSAPKPRRRSGP